MSTSEQNPGAAPDAQTEISDASRGLEKEPWTENRPPGGWLPRIDFREFWSYRALTFHLGARDVKLRYKQTLFGVTWAVLQPLTAAAIFTVIFGRLVDVPSDGVPYLVFAYSGMIAWTFFSGAVTGGAESLVQHRALVTHVYFPRLLAPLAALVPALVDLVVALAILVGLLAATGVTPGWAAVSTPVWILALGLVSAAFGIWLAALNVLYRDVRYALGFVMQVLFFVSPVIFSSALFRDEWGFLYAVNPLVGVLDGFRWAVADAPAPGPEDLISLASGTVLLVVGVAYFQKVERILADAI